MAEKPTIDEFAGALRALLTNKHVDLVDLVYTIRERESLVWEGPSVKAWSDAVTNARTLLERYDNA